MTPRDVDALSDREYEALVRYANKETREIKRAARRRR